MLKQFIWIMTDTTRWNMLGCYGNPAMKTPCLDAMAGEGIRFERAYTCQPVCGPARSALFTGLFPHSNGSWGNSMPLGADVQTIGRRLTDAGIHAGYIGKWHLDAGDYFGNGVCPDGWDPDYWYDMKNYLDELTPEERAHSRDEAASDGDVDPAFTFGYRVTHRALDFIRKHKNEDFFLVISYDEPHGPFLAPEPYASMYKGYEAGKTPAHGDALEDKPMLQKIWAGENLARNRRGDPVDSHRLLGCNSYVDSLIGEVLDEVKTTLPAATALFTSDHGDAMRAHGLTGKGPSVYDEIARVPLIFAGEGVPKGCVYPHTVSHIDLAATVLDYMGLARPVVFEGESLLPVLADPQKATNRPAFVEFTRYEIDHDGFGGFQPMRAVVTDDYKLVINLMDTDELYDVKNDPYNLKNRIDDPAHAAIRDRLHDEIIRHMNDTRDPFRGYQWQVRPWRKDKEPSWAVDGYTRQRENDPGQYRQLDYNTGLPMETATRKK